MAAGMALASSTDPDSSIPGSERGTPWMAMASAGDAVVPAGPGFVPAPLERQPAVAFGCRVLPETKVPANPRVRRRRAWWDTSVPGHYSRVAPPVPEMDQIKLFVLPNDAGVLNRQPGTFRDPDGSKWGCRGRSSKASSATLRRHRAWGGEGIAGRYAWSRFIGHANSDGFEANCRPWIYRGNRIL